MSFTISNKVKPRLLVADFATLFKDVLVVSHFVASPMGQMEDIVSQRHSEIKLQHFDRAECHSLTEQAPVA